MVKILALFLYFVPLVVGGCASVDAQRPGVESTGALSPAVTSGSPMAARVAGGDYTVQPGDQIQVRFYYHPDHDQDLAVHPDGKIVLRGVGEVEAAGQTPTALAKRIAARYSERHLRDPEVEVQVTRFAGQRVYVGGEVGKPGFVPLTQGMTTLQAVVEAGGLRDTAKLASVVIVRRPVGSGSPPSESIVVNLEAVLEDRDVSKDVELQPYDIVFVPKTTIVKMNEFVERYILRMLPVRPSWFGLGF